MSKISIPTLLADIETVVKKHGKQGLIDKINEMPEPEAVNGGCQPGRCPDGQIWSSITCNCVPDIG